MNRLVLVADGNAGRGRELAEACRLAEVECKSVAHGAAALELALAAQPALVVTEVDLPLVDGIKLAEILRANPRTRGTRFLFLAEEEGRLGNMSGVGDELLLCSTRREDVVARIEALIERQDRIDSLDAATDGGGRVTGELAQTSLVDLLQLFHLSRRSGHIVLVMEDELSGEAIGVNGLMHIREGEVIRAEVGEVQGEKALFRMLGWRCGRFTFEPGDVEEPASILMSTSALLVEGVRQGTEWDRLSPKFPPLDARIRLQVTPNELPNIVHPLTQEVLLLVEIYPRVRDVVDRCSYPDYQVLRTLHTLVQREIVEIHAAPVEPAPTPIAPEPSSRLFDDAQIRWLRDWLETSSAGSGPSRTAKLVIASSDPGALPDFTHLMHGIEGVELEPALSVETPAQLASELRSLGRIDVDDGFALDLIHVPVDGRFAPLWPIAGHGALATIFLLDGPVGEAAERVRSMNAALQLGTRSRIFHVVLLRKGERVSPDDLRENFALIDEASVYLLPLEGSKQPIALLKSLFARVLGGAVRENRG